MEGETDDRGRQGGNKRGRGRVEEEGRRTGADRWRGGWRRERWIEGGRWRDGADCLISTIRCGGWMQSRQLKVAVRIKMSQ